MIVLHSFGKRFYAIFFCFCSIFYCLDPLTWIVNLFARSMTFQHIRKYHSWDQVISQIQLWKYQSQIFVDIERIAYLLSWVLCILNLYWNFKIFRSCHLRLIISVLFKWIHCKVFRKRCKISHLKCIFRC